MNEPNPISRRNLLAAFSTIGVGSLAFQRALAAQVAERATLTPAMLKQAEWISGVELTEDERDSITRAVRRNLLQAARMREMEIDADESPVLVFRPDFFYSQVHQELGVDQTSGTNKVDLQWQPLKTSPPSSEEELAFMSLTQQASLLDKGSVSSKELTENYLSRLTKYDPLLECVVSLLSEHALEMAEASDRRRRAGELLGPLDGIPWVAKDIIAIPPWRTTWGARPFRDQIRTEKATVAAKLADAGTVLLAKVTTGAMAWGDRWYGGFTRNPWQTSQGSSGSSAGSAASVAAGLASFALGSETLGSIVSPCNRCRVSGLRPTFGRVSRAGCMPLSWSMDKIGPIARSVSDLALVFAAIQGADGRDPTIVERGFRWPLHRSLDGLRVGVTPARKNPTEERVLEFLESEGAILTELETSTDIPESTLSFILGVEASTVFDDSYRENPRDDYGLWPNTFHQSQFTPAIQYLRANRLRAELVRETERRLLGVDLVVGDDDLLRTNLTGHPSLVVACGQEENPAGNRPGVAKLTGRAYSDDLLLHVGQEIQRAMPPSPRSPDLAGQLAQLERPPRPKP